MQNKNSLQSYGLTLVAGLPLPVELSARIADLQQEIEESQPGQFKWYAPLQFHVTLASLLRGRYRSVPPLTRDELPEDLEAFIEVLAQATAQIQPFNLEFNGALIGKDGEFVIMAYGGEEARRVFNTIHTHFQELDPPKTETRMHATIGFFKKPMTTSLEKDHFDALHRNQHFIGSCKIDAIWLVHYSIRTLERLKGKIQIPLGSPWSLTKETLKLKLRICQVFIDHQKR